MPASHISRYFQYVGYHTEIIHMYNLFNFLSVAECFFVTNAGIATIATLPKLEVSIMNYLRLVTNINLWAASNLKRLECRDSKFTDRIIINAIESAIVCLSKCQYITNKSLEKTATLTVS